MHLERMNNEQSMLESVWINAKMLQLMTSSMLQRQRFYSGESVMALSPLDRDQLDMMIENLVRLFESYLVRKQMTFRINFEDHFTHCLMAEWELFELFLFHLISNAAKFSSTGGCISINILLCQSPETISMKVNVRDTGIGITDEKLQRIKVKLASECLPKIMVTRDTTTVPGQDVGFGLSTANMLAQLLGGELTLTSYPWYKTEGSITFPVKMAPARPKEQK